MLKRILGTKWWIVAVLVCAIGVPFMAYQKHRAAQEYRDNRARYCAAFMPTETQKVACEEEKATADDYLNGWYKLFEWPEGITAWAIIGTGFAIAWQSSETRKAAEATVSQASISRQALVAQFRPKIVIRRMRLDPDRVLYFDRRADKKWTLEMQIHNPGGTTAHVLKCEGYFQIHGGDGGWSKENVGVLYINTPFDVPAGGKHPVNLELPGDQLRGILTMYESFLKDDPHSQYVRDFLAYHGTITYRDDNGLDRETGFSRNFYMKTAQFLASSNPEAEYQD